MEKQNDPTQVPIPMGIWGIGIVQFLINTSTVMVFGIAAIYLKAILSVSIFWIGFLEATVEGIANLMRIVSGVISDYLQRRKRLMMIGYGIMAVARPVLALSSTFALVFTARIIDRFGNGIQATPRDALVGDLAPPSRKGACFGLRQTLGTAGSFFGGIVGITAMIVTDNDFHTVFWLAAVPAVMAFILLAFLVKEPRDLDPKTANTLPKRQPMKWSDIPRLGKGFWMLMIVVGIFMLARLSEAFLILHAHSNFGLANEYTPVILILYNATYSASSYPIGLLSDRLGRYQLLAVGICVLIITDLMLAFAPSLWVALLGVMMWGVQMGISQSMFLSLVADHVPEDLRGTGFGTFYLISAISLFCASMGAGQVAELWSEGASFFASFIIASIALSALMVLKPKMEVCHQNS